MNEMVKPPETPRVGNYMHTSNGKKYWPMDPRPEEVHIEVIAHHLATRCRYNGAVRHPLHKRRIFYSVAEHSVLVALFCLLLGADNKTALIALLHDGSESYNGDLIRPLKYDPTFREPFKIVEERNEVAISVAFDLPYPFPPIVKQADEAVTAAEVAQIVPRCESEVWDRPLHDESVVAPFKIAMLEPIVARDLFLDLYRRLTLDLNVPRDIQSMADFLREEAVKR